MNKPSQILVQCFKCGKWQYVREDSLCADGPLCSACATDGFYTHMVPQAPKEKDLPITHCQCGRAITTHTCVDYDCPTCMKG